MTRAGRLAELRGSRLLHGSAWVLVGMAAQAALGFAFWTVGARVSTAGDVGRASALFTVAQFLNYASGLGLTVMLARFAADPSADADRLMGWSVVAATVTSAVGVVVFGLVASDAATTLVRDPASLAAFAVYVAGIAVGLLADVRLMAARRWRWLVGRIVVVGLVRLPLVLWNPGVGDDTWLSHLMLAPLAIGGWLSFPMLRLIGEGRLRLGRPAELGAAARFAGANWFATLTSAAPQFVLPLIVAANLDDERYASFFLGWTVTGMVLLVPGAISQILLLEGSKAEAAGADHARQAFRSSVGIAVLAWLGAFAGGRVAAWLLGDGFAELARLLPALVFAGVPWALTSVRLSEARIRRDQLGTVVVTAVLGVVTLGLAALWTPRWGVAGASRAWIVGNVTAALCAELRHRTRPPSPAPPPAC